ncbi:MAG: hypothetical protein V6Z81_06050, partial [Parvularculales bacterium]
MPNSSQTQHPSLSVPDRAAWEALATDTLRGRPLSALDGHTEDGLPIHPLYWAGNQAALPYLPRPRR